MLFGIDVISCEWQIVQPLHVIREELSFAKSYFD